MRKSSRVLLAFAALLAAGISAAIAEEPPPDSSPTLEVSVSVGRSYQGPNELLGRPVKNAIYASFQAQEPGGRIVYFQPVSFALAPDDKKHAVKQVGDLTFDLRASSSAIFKRVQTAVVVSRGERVLSRYLSSLDVPPSKE